VFRDKELDKGFVLRANEEVAKLLQKVIKSDKSTSKTHKPETDNAASKEMNPVPSEFNLTLFDSNKRLYG